MPAAVAWSASARGAPPPVLHLAVSASVAVALAVGAYSLWQVRAGRWSHVDAPVPGERRQLNVFLVLLLFGVSGALWAFGQPLLVSLGLGLGGAVVLAAHLLRRWLKLSLHASFAVYAAALLWPAALAAGAVLLLAVAVSWSRLALRRHTLAEVLAGLAVGAAAGWVFNAVVRY
jgi:membrane-associated phospholipid phosphatase